MTIKEKTVKIKVDNPIMAYAALELHSIKCSRIGDYVIINEADYQLAESLVEEWKI